MLKNYYPTQRQDGEIIARTFPDLSLIKSDIDVDPGSVKTPLKLHALLTVALYEEWIHGGNTNLGFARARLLANKANHTLLHSYRNGSKNTSAAEIKSALIHNALVGKKLHRESFDIVEISDKFIHQSLAQESDFVGSVANHTASFYLERDGSLPAREDRKQEIRTLLKQSQRVGRIINPDLYDRLVQLREETGSIIFVKLVIDCALDIPHPPTLEKIPEYYRTSQRVDEIDFERRLQLLLDELETRTGLSEHPAIIDAKHHEEQNLRLGYAPPSSLEHRLIWYIYHEIAQAADVKTPLQKRRPALHNRSFPLIEIPYSQSQASFLNKIDYLGTHFDDDSVVKSEKDISHNPDNKPSLDNVLFGFGFIKLFSVVAAIAFPNGGEDVLYLNPDIKDEELPEYGDFSYEELWKRRYVHQKLLDDLLRYSTGQSNVEFTCPICRNFDLVYPKEKLIFHREFHELAAELRSRREAFRAIEVDEEDDLTKLLESETEDSS